MKKLIDFLVGKKTYIIVAIAVIVNGCVALGYIGAEEVELINWILVTLGLGAIRLAVDGK
jgi:hypothetical protein